MRVQGSRLLAKTLDKLGSGGIESLVDNLSQQFKSLEMEAEGWPELAEALQLVGLDDMGLTSRAEVLAATKFRRLKLKLKDGKIR